MIRSAGHSELALLELPREIRLAVPFQKRPARQTRYQGRLRFTHKWNSATHVRLGNQTTRFGGASDGHREHARWFRWIATAVLSTREGVILLESPIHLIKCWVRSACGGLRRLWACVALDAPRVYGHTKARAWECGPGRTDPAPAT